MIDKSQVQKYQTVSENQGKTKGKQKMTGKNKPVRHKPVRQDGVSKKQKQESTRMMVIEIACTILLYILFLLSVAAVFYLIDHGGGQILWRMLYGDQTLLQY